MECSPECQSKKAPSRVGKLLVVSGRIVHSSAYMTLFVAMLGFALCDTEFLITFSFDGLDS